MKLHSRVNFADLLNERGIRRGIEIGCDRGLFASALLERWKCAEVLVCVDPWAPYDQMDFDRLPDLLIAVQLLAPYRQKFRLLRMTGHRAAELMPGLPYHHPGFVYIDGDHAYASAKADIADWWPQVVSGGILAGHDYTQECSGVRQAVDEFVRTEGLELHTTLEPQESVSWWVTKP
jgi:hypothetical protein